MTVLSARIERLPFSGFHRRLLLIGGLGYTFDAMDAAVIAFVLPVLRTAWNLDSGQVGVLASANFIGFFFGALLAGSLGDLIGRRMVMMSALAVYCVASFFSAMVNDWNSFLVLRVLAGLGTGAESVIIAPYLSEFVARRYRGRFTGALAGFFSFGFVAAALLGYLIVPASEDGWRIVILITAAPVLMLLWWRRVLPESPRWLESQGRNAEADAIVAAMEHAIVRGGQPLPALDPHDVAAAPPSRERGGLLKNYATLLSRRLLPTTSMTWLMWLSITFSYYTFFTWIPSLLVQNGMTMTKSFGYSLVMYLAQVPGYFSAAWLNDRIGRQATIVSYMLMGMLAALGMAFARGDAQIMAAGVLLSFFLNGTYAGVYAYTPEVFPTQVRATGAGLASAIGRIGGITAPILVGYVYPKLGFAGVFGTTTAALLMGSAAVWIMGVPTRGRSLEDIATEKIS
ncbi:MFS transporter [Verminephrobacter aporrectodeae subsp. tuberculatae]|uniref:MFS transporter n=1 Tax=Verminephrobacter aporrectodeae subsp. tuberculatae TaxID=1110392 RepID=A0ABT3KTU1_9BURK|nr:MFS transporter [Verminephrobacter aporrectodeae]MCW5321750.1 MFS transporter [Verminephrobacter aporrectodeae subsp. tuberculatae]